MRLERILFIISLIVVLSGVAFGYSTYGSPSEFGNETTTTAWVGGDDGILNITGNAKIDGNTTSSNFFGFLNWSWIQNSPLYMIVSDFSTYFDSNFSSKTTDDLTQGSTNLYANQTLNNELYWNKTENINASGYNGTFNYLVIESPSVSCETVGTNCFTVQVNGSVQTCVCLDESILNVNNSQFLNGKVEGALDVNSADLWDSLDDPSDILTSLLNNDAGFLSSAEGLFNSSSWNRTGTNVVLAHSGDSVNITSNLVVGGNITASYFIGDGSELTGVAGGIWENKSGTANYQGNVNISQNLSVYGTGGIVVYYE